jgi:spore germination protein GerM
VSRPRLWRLFVTPFNVVALLAALAVFGVRAVQQRPVQPRVDQKLLDADRPPPRRELRLRLYFASPSADGFVLEPRAASVARDAPNERLAEATRQWLAGPKTTEALRLVPAGTPAPTVFVRRDTAYLDLPEAWTRLGLGSAGELLVLCGLANTLLEAGPVSRVSFIVSGRPAESLGGHVALDEPFTAKTCRGG